MIEDAQMLLDRLVGFPSVSSESNLDLIDFVESYLDSHGIRAVRVHDDKQAKAAIYANIGPEVEDGVVLSGHSDVVPVDGQAWDTNPFVLTERDGKLFGRGTCDMKGFVALSLAAVPLALERDITRPIQIAISYDEEIGMTGAPKLIDHMLNNGMPKAKAVIVGEPSRMDIINAHNGGFGYEVSFRGFEVHSSIMHKGVSAVMMAARLIEWANQMNERGASSKPAGLSKQFDPHYTTVHVGKISGGTALNITAKNCDFVIDFRVVPGDDFAEWMAAFEAEVAQLDAQMKNVHPDTGIDCFQDFYAPGLMPEENGPARELVAELTGANTSRVVSFLTEGGLFQERGYSTIVCGPGNIAQAHQPNEFISIEQFHKGAEFMSRLVDKLDQH
ncbi:acetylornithine deacetylase [uncultured Roseovarius sp.]|uniref:acetylornithine deacetylase n=1 Tax=uncultured Roseovarius sp. TaxID=293344 RepID=UPI00260376A2|nr:acetylornithine deacetylase [uncultured Roseovarius sp.]